MTGGNSTDELSWRKKLDAVYNVMLFRPQTVAGILFLSIIAAFLEGFGVSFILPIVQLAQSGSVQPSEADGLIRVFIRAYDTVGIPFTLLNIVFGVMAVMTARYTVSFAVAWLRQELRIGYVVHLQNQAFQQSLDTRITYFDKEGSDDVLNTIVTQAEYAGDVIQYGTTLIEQGSLALIYFGIAFYLSPQLTLFAAVILGGLTWIVRGVIENGYDTGGTVADAKERIQSNAQKGVQGIRELKLFGLSDEISSGFFDAITKFRNSQVKILKTKAAINNFYQLAVSIVIFSLIYLALTVSQLSLGSMGVFLFAMFRLGPRVSNLNGTMYGLEGQLPHLVRTQEFVKELEDHKYPTGGEQAVPDTVEQIEFDGVEFSYEGAEETALQGVSFEVAHDEMIAFIGPSGAGKSTIISLFTRMYERDEGVITADRISIDKFSIDDWRNHISIVQQDPHLFNETLRWNLTIGDRDASQEEIERVCEIAQVTEFIDDLPAGYETVLGDDSVKLSGGQRQRVAIARALLKDVDFLLLDEATSDLDTSLEKKVHTGIEDMDREFGIVLVAHRLSTVTNADRIYSMDQGKIKEVGGHEALIESDGQYAHLYDMQA